MDLKAILVTVTLGCAVSAPGGLAQTEPAKPGEPRFGNPTATARTLQGYVYGIIKKIGATELVLDKTEFGDEQTFKLEPKTKYIHDRKPSSLTKLKVGDQVWVDMKKDKKTGEMVAKKVVTGVAPTEVP